GNALDFDHWAREPGLEDWTYLDCLPYFRKAETRDIGANDYHGDSGPVSVCTPKTGNNPLFHAMVEAGVQAGYARTDDLNGYRQEGFGPMDRTVTPRGRRASTARGYLDQARRRPNLTILTHALTERILFDGRRATGVSYLRGSSNRAEQAHARREVLLCAGASASPQIRQPAGHRRRMAVRRHRHRRQQPFRGRRLHPHRRVLRLAEHPVPLPAGGHQLQRQQRGEGARLPGPRGLHALAEPRPGACPLPGPA